MPVNLTVHRNTVEKRRRRRALDSLESCVKHERKTGDMMGFALVTWDKDLKAEADWHTSNTRLPAAVLPEFIKMLIMRKIGDMDAERLIRNMFDIPDDSA